MGEKITVRIGKGKADIKTEGFSGEYCLLAVAKLKQAYGGKSVDTPTDEMFKAPETEIDVQG